jgi:hypothetical protein
VGGWRRLHNEELRNIYASRRTECSALYDNKIECYMYSTIKCIAEIDTFPNTGPHTVPYVLSRSQYGAISGMTHIKTTVNFFSTGVGKHLLTRSEVLMILSRNSVKFYIFSR